MATTTRVALVTGGMGGLGEAICLKLAALGDKVVTTFSPGNKKAQEWLDTMTKRGYAFRAFPCDITNWDSTVDCVKKVTAEVGPIDVLVNNAGISRHDVQENGQGQLGCRDQDQSRFVLQHDEASVRRHGRAR